MVFNEITDDYLISDQRTQLTAFNELELFDYTNENQLNLKNSKMNIICGMLHEGGHLKLHMNTKIGAKLSPILYIDK